MSNPKAATVIIGASQAEQYGLRSILNSGEVRTVVPHNRTAVTIKDIVTFNLGKKRELIVKNGQNKRDKFALSSIRGYGVSPELAEKVRAKEVA
ncbi:MAG: hypothetical protein HOE19_02230 [Candidatus Komeilibacteria bacterium]|nr:hypothetical protein [Candidatus Komeilibacteria bacterium]MBT4447190.1 hypothetical protein [Candidatus Komeilibacteria bacterium]